MKAQTLKQVLPGISAEHKATLCRVINTHSSGGHPYADRSTLPFFKCAFVLKTVERAERKSTGPSGFQIELARRGLEGALADFEEHGK